MDLFLSYGFGLQSVTIHLRRDHTLLLTRQRTPWPSWNTADFIIREDLSKPLISLNGAYEMTVEADPKPTLKILGLYYLRMGMF